MDNRSHTDEAAMTLKKAFAWTLCLCALGLAAAMPAAARIFESDLYNWIASGEFRVPIGFRIDALSVIMCLVVTGVGFLIHVYSIGYMHDDPGFKRFFIYLNLFVFMMLLLVTGNSLLLMFVGWEGVGLSSYLLIGFWYERPPAADAAKKAFLTNRIGDWGFLLGVFLIYYTFGSLDFRVVANAAAAALAAAVAPPRSSWPPDPPRSARSRMQYRVRQCPDPAPSAASATARRRR